MSFLDIPEGTDVINVRTQMNKMLSEARKNAKPTKCILCGKTQTSFAIHIQFRRWRYDL